MYDYHLGCDRKFVNTLTASNTKMTKDQFANASEYILSIVSGRNSTFISIEANLKQLALEVDGDVVATMSLVNDARLVKEIEAKLAANRSQR